MFKKLSMILKNSSINFKKDSIQVPVKTYKDLVNDASYFTASQGFKIDNLLSNQSEDILSLIKEISVILVNELPVYKQNRFNPIEKLGGDCGNVHHTILSFIKQHYPQISANLTIGEFRIDDIEHFEFDQKKCIKWLQFGSPEMLDCHTWITIDNDFILDCTVGTYINTRLSDSNEANISKNLFGGVIYGRVGNLSLIPFQRIKHLEPKGYSCLEYSPVILGKEAFEALAPKQPS